MLNRRELLGGVTVALTAGLLASCDEDPLEATPRGSADLIANGLASADLSKAPIVGGDATERLRATIKGLGTKPSVTVVKVIDDPFGSAWKKATLRYRWELRGASPWEYDVVVPLELQQKKWVTPWSSTLVHPDLRPREELTYRVSRGERGRIVGRGGVALVEPRPVYNIGIDKPSVTADQQDASAKRLATLVEIDPATFAQQVAKYGPQAFVEAITLRVEDVDPDLARRIDQIPGARRLREMRHLAPSSGFARAVLGTVGAATAEVIKQGKGSVKNGDIVGLAGLQRRYEPTLGGSGGLTVIGTVPGADGPETSRTIVEPKDAGGSDLKITLDEALQLRAEELLARHKDVPSALVAIRPSTGELLVIASGPGAKGADTAREGRYPPGSTFKVVSSLAMLRSGLTPDTTVDCTPTITANGRQFRNFPDYPSNKLGNVPYRTALANSCNTVMIRGGEKANQQALAQAAETLGMTQSLGDWGFTGSVPEGDTGAEHDASMIGQGRLLASPLGMAAVAASVVAGQRVTPYLVPGDKPKPPAAPAAPITEREATDLRDLMRAVVTEGGATSLATLPGEPVLAKTGTAEFGTDDPPQAHSWMIAAQGDLAVSVFVEGGGYGGVVCAPIVRDFLAFVSDTP